MEPNDEIEMESDAEETAGNIHDEAPSVDIIDLVMDGKATEARDAIYATLYQKVGEKVDALRSELRQPTETEVDAPTPEEPAAEQSES